MDTTTTSTAFRQAEGRVGKLTSANAWGRFQGTSHASPYRPKAAS